MGEKSSRLDRTNNKKSNGRDLNLAYQHWFQSSFQSPVWASLISRSLATFLSRVSKLLSPVRFRCGSHLDAPRLGQFGSPASRFGASCPLTL